MTGMAACALPTLHVSHPLRRGKQRAPGYFVFAGAVPGCQPDAEK